jgi:hypothetical protein
MLKISKNAKKQDLTPGFVTPGFALINFQGGEE